MLPGSSLIKQADEQPEGIASGKIQPEERPDKVNYRALNPLPLASFAGKYISAALLGILLLAQDAIKDFACLCGISHTVLKGLQKLV